MRTRGGGLAGALLAGALLAGAAALSACSPEPASVKSPLPHLRDEAKLAALRPAPTTASPAGDSKYQGLAERMRAQGLLRTDGGAGIPLSDTVLTRNFVDIALHDEYRRGAKGLVARKTPANLTRWEQPIRYHTTFGGSVEGEQRARDLASMQAYLARIARLSGRDISPTENRESANFHIAILGEAERLSARGYLQQVVPGIDDQTIAALTRFDADTNCAVAAFSRPGAGGYIRAAAVIRNEIPPLFRLACFHEELAQAMGLSNDSPRARPSIFNDDEEFATLTAHDAYLMQILYDPRLSSGMDQSEAEPIVRQIARELLDTGRAN